MVPFMCLLFKQNSFREKFTSIHAIPDFLAEMGKVLFNSQAFARFPYFSFFSTYFGYKLTRNVLLRGSIRVPLLPIQVI